MQLLPFNHQSSLLYDAVRIYTGVWGRNHEESLIFFRQYARFSGFAGYVASVKTRIVGMVFGTHSQPGQWWHDKVSTQVGAGHPALQDAWVLTELAVLKAYRNQHIGAHLHDRVLQDVSARNLLLSTQVYNHGARRFYERLGWRILHTGFAFHAGRDEYCIMHKPHDTLIDGHG